MKKSLLILLISLLTVWPAMVNAQTPTPTPSPTTDTSVNAYYKEQDEVSDPAMQDAGTDPQSIFDGTMNQLNATLNNLNAAYGTTDDNGNYVPGVFDALKLKPSDVKRLIQIGNGSLTAKQKSEYTYDSRLMNLLVTLTTPTELGGEGITWLRVGDLLRFKADPRSTETENTENVSAHQHGEAADIVEIGQTQCTASSLLGGSHKLPPFPVKVAWQGGAPYSTYSALANSFDAVARDTTLAPLYERLPESQTYPNLTKNFSDTSQLMARRVIAIELGLPANSLDYVVDNDLLETLGRVSTAVNLGLSPGSLTGTTTAQVSRSTAESALENALNLPIGSLKGDDWNTSLENLGRYTLAYDAGVNPVDIVAGKVSEIANSPYIKQYARAEAAFRLPSGTLAGAESNSAAAFRQIGAQAMADTLKYSATDAQTLITQAQNNAVRQFSLASYGSLTNFAGQALLILAPASTSNKAAGEQYVGNSMINASFSINYTNLPTELKTVLGSIVSGNNPSRSDIATSLTKDKNSIRDYRLIGASLMETVFSLPPGSLYKAVSQYGTPTVDQYIPILGAFDIGDVMATNSSDINNNFPQLTADPKTADKDFNLASGTTSKFVNHQMSASDYINAVGKAYMANDFINNFEDLYHVTTTGLSGLTTDQMFSVVLGQINDAQTRAGASWIEEDMGLPPDTFSALFATASAQDKLVASGLSAVGGVVFNTFDINTANITTKDALITALGRAFVETTIGLKPNTFQGSLANIKAANGDRFDTVFADPSSTDAMLQLPSGTTAKFLNGSLAPDDLAKQAITPQLSKLNVKTLEQTFGWTSDFAVDGTKLYQAIQSGDMGTVRSTLATIGGYDLDSPFGYQAGTFASIVNGDLAAQNLTILTQGSNSYARQIGVILDNANQWLDTYKNTGAALITAIGNLNTSDATQLLATAAGKKFADRLNAYGVNVPASDITSFLTGDMSKANDMLTAAAMAANMKFSLPDPALNNAKYLVMMDLIHGSSGDTNTDKTLSNVAMSLYNGVLHDYATSHDNSLIDSALTGITKGVLNNLGKLDSNASPYTTGVPGKYGASVEECQGMGNSIDFCQQQFSTGGGASGSSSLLSSAKIQQLYFSKKEALAQYFYGPMDSTLRQKDPSLPANFSQTMMTGSNQAKSQMMLSFAGNLVGSQVAGLPPNFLQTMTRGTDSAKNDAMMSFANNLLATKIAGLPTNFLQTMTSGTDVDKNKALSTFADGLIAIQVPGLPANFTQTLTSGSTADKTKALTSLADNIIGSQVYGLPANFTQTLISGSATAKKQMITSFGANLVTSSQALNGLPPAIRATATNFLNKMVAGQFNDPSVKSDGAKLANSVEFGNLMTNTINNFLGSNFPGISVANFSAVLSLGSGNASPTLTFSDPTITVNIETVGTNLIGKQLGVSAGQIQQFKQDYETAQNLYASYQAGDLSPADVGMQIGQMLLGNEIAKVTGAVDSALGLPPGTTMYVAEYFLTGNPQYLVQAAVNVLFGQTIKCPDLQQTAQDHIQTLISDILDVSNSSAELTPSQIITYNTSFLSDIQAKIDEIYHNNGNTSGDPCPPGTLCGVFAHPEYVTHVHIGF